MIYTCVYVLYYILWIFYIIYVSMFLYDLYVCACFYMVYCVQGGYILVGINRALPSCVEGKLLTSEHLCLLPQTRRFSCSTPALTSCAYKLLTSLLFFPSLQTLMVTCLGGNEIQQCCRSKNQTVWCYLMTPALTIFIAYEMKTLNTIVSKTAAVTGAEGTAHLLCFMTLQVTPLQLITKQHSQASQNLRSEFTSCYLQLVSFFILERAE